MSAKSRVSARCSKLRSPSWKEAAASKDKKTFQLKTGADGEMTFEEAYEAHVKERKASGTDKRVYDDESVEGKMEAVSSADDVECV